MMNYENIDESPRQDRLSNTKHDESQLCDREMERLTIHHLMPRQAVKRKKADIFLNFVSSAIYRVSTFELCFIREITLREPNVEEHVSTLNFYQNPFLPVGIIVERLVLA
ncbi:MAG: hypothetical protein HC847_25325 [Hydrococcus sp. RU_2_2]|nr:hypothetical protein [Hydrococcus sp. RU_2_2]NJP20361.1 hypothetical protein [Hydrococcus sp. CRU_1_1]